MNFDIIAYIFLSRYEFFDKFIYRIMNFRNFKSCEHRRNDWGSRYLGMLLTI